MEGISLFEILLPDIEFNITGDTMICCPFKHYDIDGNAYYETNPSMGINISEKIYNCFGCGKQGNDLTFAAEFLNISTSEAYSLKKQLERTTETTLSWNKAYKNLLENPTEMEILTKKFGFTKDVIELLQIGLEGPGRGYAFPVFLFGKLMDVITYNPNNKPKYMKRVGSVNGLIMPYDYWKEHANKKTVCIVAGQKDLAIALSNDINAITFTGGEGTLPSYFTKDFTDKQVFIIYDNDETGKRGALKVATKLQPYAKTIKIIDLSSICINKNEDLWDFFMKYGKNKYDLVNLINDTNEFTDEEYEKQINTLIPLVSLSEATKNKYLNKTLRSNIQVVAIDESKFLMPSTINIKKIRKIGESVPKNQMEINDEINWTFSSDRLHELFYLIDSNLKDNQVFKYIKTFNKIPEELGIKVKIINQKPVFKSTVADYDPTLNSEDLPEEYTAYSINKKLESGKKYIITYKLLPHPLLGNKLTMIIIDVQESKDFITNFQINETIKTNLKVFQPAKDETITHKIKEIVNKIKGIVDADYNETLLLTIDLWYNTPLQFNLGKRKNLRAFLDTAIVAESRTGKSSTVQALQQLYGVGTRIPLNGHNATIAGIVGGSQKSKSGSFQTRAGVIPRNHKGAVILEEFGKADSRIMSELTEIRSSGYSAITRVNGTIYLPSLVRILGLTNTRIQQGSTIRAISSYPNGIEIIIDLIGAPEDIARYDNIAVLPQKAASKIDPFFKPDTPYPEQNYKDRIHWIWSRKPEDIIISEEIYRYAITTSNTLNEIYDSYIKLFSTETYLKLLRLAIATACYTVSTEDTFEKVLVKKEHIDFAANYLKSLYDNDFFRLKQFVEAEKQYNHVDEKSTKIIQIMWGQHNILLQKLENYSTVTAKTLQTIAGLDSISFSSVIKTLTEHQFIRHENYTIIPTEKFRKTMRKIDRNLKTRTLIL